MQLFKIVALALTISTLPAQATEVAVHETTTYQQVRMRPHASMEIVAAIAIVGVGVAVATHNPTAAEFFMRFFIECSLAARRAAPMMLKTTTTVITRR